MEQKRSARRTSLRYKFQLRLVRRAMLPLAVLSAAAMVVIWSATTGRHEYSMDELRWLGIGGVALLFVASLVGVGWSLMLYSSRLAGPLVHLEKTLAAIAAGDLSTRVHLRKDDELQEHAAHLNRTFMSLQDRVKRIHQYCRYARETVDRLAASPDVKDKDQLDQMRQLIGFIEEALQDFKV
ncbi:MAG TPA: HAMP domain-containing protein [Leptospiraceae bacterium]|jgi:methyl-accepting chemotaxis protein|nr:HAMP domain-containing protein [Leptospirales bacterium]HMU83211.1 HAMP domain-containing protein [Leptospiraceae bacterium]HMW59241.1 HAMP domain-containing protein [Leptospiraceae bacterium]HMX55139.1 HAMP domain-containing protein [Leptospiraceae bacterium]HMY44194.1 HAMP domain-containing protein [Leptospiraceae bacterium]